MALTVAIVGDSVMWGQGLLSEHTFGYLAGRRIADARHEELVVLPGLGIEPVRGHARSGAKIRAREDPDRRLVEVVLPSGLVVTTPLSDRAEFALTFPNLFSTDEEMENLLTGANEAPAAQLFGENPAALPSITAQIRDLIGEESRRDVDVVLVNGGANDAEYEEILGPAAPTPQNIDRMLEKVFQRDLAELLTLARDVFPRALIIVTGYFSVLSQDSSRNDLEVMAKYFADESGIVVAVNDVFQDIPIVRDFWNNLGPGVDVASEIRHAIARSIFAAAHAHFWMLHAIARLPTTVVGRGILYADPAFDSQHALFASGEPFFHEGYRFPGADHHPVSDEMLTTRMENIPRLDLLDLYRAIMTALAPSLSASFEERPPILLSTLRPLAQDLLSHPDLTTPVFRAAEDMSESAIPDDRPLELFSPLVWSMWLAVTSEISRIERTIIASFIHPNAAGHRRYADRIALAHRRHVQFSVRAAIEQMGQRQNGVLSVAASLRRYGLQPSLGLRHLKAMAFIESVAAQFFGLRRSSFLGFDLTPPRFVSLRLVLGRRVFQMDWQLATDSQDIFRAWDVTDEAELAEITSITVDLGHPEAQLSRVVVFINGRIFFTSDTQTVNVERGVAAFHLIVE